MDVRLPSGQVIRGVPEGTPKEVIMQKAISAGLATEQDFLGQMEPPAAAPKESFTPTGASPRMRRASQLANKQEAERKDYLSTLPSAQRALLEDISGPEAFLIGMGRGFTTVGRGLGLAEPETEQERQAIQALEEVQPTATVGGEIIGEAAPFIPLGMGANGLARTVGQRALATGATGALEGGTIAAGRGGDSAEVVQGALAGAAIGSGAELAFPVISRAGRSVYRRLTGKTDEAASVADNLITPEGLNPDAAKQLEKEGIEIDDFLRETIDESDMSNDQRRAVFESLGLDPTQAQITRDKDLFRDQIEAARRSGEVTKAIERQEEILNSVAQGQLSEIGGTGARANASASNAIIDKAVELDDEIGNLYQMARESTSDAKNVRFTETAKALRQNAPSNELSGGIVQAIRGNMEQAGVLDGFKPSGRVSVDQAEELRKTVNRLSRSASPEGKYIAGQIKDALDKDALQASGEDFYKQARKAKFDFEKGLSTETKSKFGKRSTSLVRDILEEKIPEDKIADKVITRGSKYDAKSLKELKNYLQTGTEGQIAQGSQAWNDIRANAFDRILSDAFRGSVDAQGNKYLSRAGLEKGFKQIGPDKMSVLFSPKEMSFLRKLAQVSALKEAPPMVGVSPSGPAIERLQQTVLDGFSRIPGLKVVGTEAREALENTINKAKDRKLLEKMATDAELLEKEATNQFYEKLRKSTGGQVLTGAAPALGVAATQE
jgi:hypothetical protein